MVSVRFELKGEKGLRSYLDRVSARTKPIMVKTAHKYLTAVAKRARELSKGPWSRGGPDSISNSINVLKVGDNSVKLTITSPHARMQEDGIGTGFITAKSASIGGLVGEKKMPLRGKGGMPETFAFRVSKFRPKRFLGRSIDEKERLLNALISKAGDKILGGK